jgi:hypothetical protein
MTAELPADWRAKFARIEEAEADVTASVKLSVLLYEASTKHLYGAYGLSARDLDKLIADAVTLFEGLWRE